MRVSFNDAFIVFHLGIFKATDSYISYIFLWPTEMNTDIHNMILFLQSDINKPHPVGFENIRRNIFDPEEDPTPAVVQDLSTMSDDDTQMREVEVVLDNRTNPELSRENLELPTEIAPCARDGCHRKPRFDSVFCSDSCGLNTLETDLLHSLKYAQQLHPSVLRS